MRALLLAAGMGTRLRPITDTIPKCLVPIHGRTLLDYWLDLLFSHDDIERALINTHYLAPMVDAFIADSRWRNRIDTVYEGELLGTGGTLLANRSYFGRDNLLLAHADNLTTFDVARFINAHAQRPKGCIISMLTFRTDDPKSCGVLEVDDQNIVQAFHEKVAEPPTNLANAAVYIVEPEVADFAATLGRPFVDMSTEIIPHFVGQILAVETTGYHRDIGNIESLRRAHIEFTPKS